MVHTCPRCDLRFSTAIELNEHLELDHPTETSKYEPFRYPDKSRPAPVHEGRRYLVVAAETLRNRGLLDRIRELHAQRPSSFHLLVPTGAKDRDLGQLRLREALEHLRTEAIDAEGELGEADPYHAVAELLEQESERFDEILVSTLPAGISRWLRVDLSHRLERRFDLPVTTLTPIAR